MGLECLRQVTRFRWNQLTHFRAQIQSSNLLLKAPMTGNNNKKNETFGPLFSGFFECGFGMKLKCGNRRCLIRPHLWWRVSTLSTCKWPLYTKICSALILQFDHFATFEIFRQKSMKSCWAANKITCLRWPMLLAIQRHLLIAHFDGEWGSGWRAFWGGIFIFPFLLTFTLMQIIQVFFFARMNAWREKIQTE